MERSSTKMHKTDLFQSKPEHSSLGDFSEISPMKSDFFRHENRVLLDAPALDAIIMLFQAV
jgi:hypothetical protein